MDQMNESSLVLSPGPDMMSTLQKLKNPRRSARHRVKNHLGAWFQKQSFRNPGKEWFQHSEYHRQVKAFLQLPSQGQIPFFLGHTSIICLAVSTGQVSTAVIIVETMAEKSRGISLGQLLVLYITESLSFSQSQEQKRLKVEQMWWMKRGQEFLKRQQGPSSKGILLRQFQKLEQPFLRCSGKVLSATKASLVAVRATAKGDETIAPKSTVGSFLNRLQSNPPQFPIHPPLNSLKAVSLGAISRAATLAAIWNLFVAFLLKAGSLWVSLNMIHHCLRLVGVSYLVSMALKFPMTEVIYSWAHATGSPTMSPLSQHHPGVPSRALVHPVTLVRSQQGECLLWMSSSSKNIIHQNIMRYGC